MMAKENKTVDQMDLTILRVLESEARITAAQLAQKVGMSGPGVAERIRRLESAGIIKRFTAEIDLAALGYTLEAIVRIKPRPGQFLNVEKMIVDEARFTSCDRVTGEDCFVARLAFRSISELDDILTPLLERAETSSAIVKSSPVRNRVPL